MQGKLRNYEICNKLGQGSYGIIFKAINRNSQKVCVLKQIKLGRMSQRARKNAINEAIIMGKLNHPFIVRYIQSFTDDNCLNIVMEYCDNKDLAVYLKNQNKKPIKEEKVWQFFIQICMGLQYIHRNKILHRDIKTLNIFLNKNQDIKIGDLGVAKMLNSQQFAQTMVGTPFYLSPELCQEKPYNQKSDIWALGCLLYQLCTYRHPFQAANQVSLILKIVRGKYAQIPEFYSKQLKDMIDMCLERDYKRRPTAQIILSKPKVKQMTQLFKFEEIISSYENNNPIKGQLNEIRDNKNKDSKKYTEKSHEKLEIKSQVEKKVKMSENLLQKKKNEGYNKYLKQGQLRLNKAEEVKKQTKQQFVANMNKMMGQVQKKMEVQKKEKNIKQMVKKPVFMQIPWKEEVKNKTDKNNKNQKKNNYEQINEKKQNQHQILQQEKKKNKQQIKIKIKIKSKSKSKDKQKQKQKSKEKQRLKQKQKQRLYSQRYRSKEGLNQQIKQDIYINNKLSVPNLSNQSQKKQKQQFDPVSYKNKPNEEIIKIKMNKPPIASKVYQNIPSKPIKSGGFTPTPERITIKNINQKNIKTPSHHQKSKKLFGINQSQDTVSILSINNIIQTKASVVRNKQSDSYLFKKKSNQIEVSSKLPPRVRKGTNHELSRNAKNVSKKSFITKQEEDQVINLPDQMSESDSANQEVDRIDDKKINKDEDQCQQNYMIQNLKNQNDNEEKEIDLKFPGMVVVQDQQKQFSSQIVDQIKDYHEQDVIQQENYCKEDYQEECYEGQQNNNLQQQNQQQQQESDNDDSDMYQINKLQLQPDIEQRSIEFKIQDNEQFEKQQQTEWSFDQQPQLPLLQQKQSPCFEQINPYLIQEESLEQKKKHLQMMLQQNIKRQDQINKLMQIKIIQCHNLIPKDFEEILQFFRNKINMDCQYNQQDQFEIDNFLKKRKLTDYRKFQNVYKIMHFQMQLENTRKIIQRICKKLGQLESK